LKESFVDAQVKKEPDGDGDDEDMPLVSDNLLSSILNGNLSL